MTRSEIPPKAARKWTRWVSVFLFLGLFFLLARTWFNSEKIELNIPVDIENIPGDLIPTHLPEKEIELHLVGPKYLFNTLNTSKKHYVLDLSTVSPGINRIPVLRDSFQFPKAFRIENITPSVFTIKIERSMTKEVPVMVTVSGKPAAGFVCVDAVARPSSVVLKGPESILGSIEKVMTKSIEIDGLSEHYKKQITLDLAEMLEITKPKGLFLAEIFIEKKIAAKTFDNIPVRGKNSPFEYLIRPDLIGIEISGPVNILEKLDAKKNIKVYVDLKDLKPGIYVKPAVITLPLETMLLSVDTEIFTVTIK